MSRNFFLRPSTERKPISPRLVWPWWYGSCCRFRVVCFGRIKATKTIQKIDYQNHQCLLSHQNHRESSSRMCVFFCFACPRLGRPEVPVRRSGARENVLLFWRGSLPSSLDSSRIFHLLIRPCCWYFPASVGFAGNRYHYWTCTFFQGRDGHPQQGLSCLALGTIRFHGMGSYERKLDGRMVGGISMVSPWRVLLEFSLCS